MTHEQHPSKAYGRVYKKETPDQARAFAAFENAVFSGEGAIPKKYLELIALGVAFTTQCQFCIEGHTANAVKAGASDQEIAEAAWVAAALRAGGAFAHGRLAFMEADHRRHEQAATE